MQRTWPSANNISLAKNEPFAENKGKGSVKKGSVKKCKKGNVSKKVKKQDKKEEGKGLGVSLTDNC